jgi:long-chain acyl-CoA synthetase
VPEFARNLAEQRPAEVAISDTRVELGWAEVDDTLNRGANALDGVGRVAVFAENSVETALAHLAGLLGGVSTVPVNFHLTAPEAAYILADSGSEILFAGPETLDRGVAAAADAGLGRIVVWGVEDLPEGCVGWEDWLAAASPDAPPTDIAPRPNLLYTSGTTGQPKGTDLPPTMFAGGATMSEHLDALKSNRFARHGTHLVVGPMYHTGPLSGMRLLVAGVPSVILGRFDAESTLRVIESHRTESAVMVPTHFIRLLALPEEVRSRFDVSSMNLVAHTGAACPIDVKRAMIDWWGPIFVEAYGGSEVGTTCSITSPEWLEHPGSVGRPVAPFEALIVDEAGEPVESGVEGRLYFRDTTGRGVIYHNDPEKSAAAHLEPGVFTLGEIGYIDADGYVYITDRFSDMVVSGGVNIYPAEAEQVLIEHPDVADVACIGVPDAEMGEQLRALVLPEAGAPVDEVEILDFCRARLTKYKCPRSVVVVDDLDRSTMGKLNKRRLRELHS